MNDRPRLFRTRRVVVEVAAAVVLAIGLLVSGYVLGGAIIEGIPRSESVQLVLLGPSDLVIAKLKLGAVMALAPLLTLVALQLHRLGARAHPGWRVALLLFAVPILAVAFGVGAQIHALHTVAIVDPMMSDQPFTIAIRDTLPGYLTGNLLAITGLVLWTAAFATARARRSMKASEPETF